MERMREKGSKVRTNEISRAAEKILQPNVVAGLLFSQEPGINTADRFKAIAVPTRDVNEAPRVDYLTALLNLDSLAPASRHKSDLRMNDYLASAHILRIP